MEGAPVGREPIVVPRAQIPAGHAAEVHRLSRRTRGDHVSDLGRRLGAPTRGSSNPTPTFLGNDRFVARRDTEIHDELDRMLAAMAKEPRRIRGGDLLGDVLGDRRPIRARRQRFRPTSKRSNPCSSRCRASARGSQDHRSGSDPRARRYEGRRQEPRARHPADAVIRRRRVAARARTPAQHSGAGLSVELQGTYQAPDCARQAARARRDVARRRLGYAAGEPGVVRRQGASR